MSYYTYIHHAGYGSDDHLALELIARAVSKLGGGSAAQAHVAAACGFVSHPVPMGAINAEIPSGPGVRRRMEAALRAARLQFPRRPSCCVSVTCIRQ